MLGIMEIKRWSPKNPVGIKVPEEHFLLNELFCRADIRCPKGTDEAYYRRFNAKFYWSTIRVPTWAFKPDDWTGVFLDGLNSLSSEWKGKKVWEVGVGTGVNLVMLHQATPEVQWFLSDYDERCVPLALENLFRFAKDDGSIRDRVRPLRGSWDLTVPLGSSGVKAPKVDVIFGCLPQVPADIDLSVGDRVAHYYDPTRYPQAHQNALGLGLVETLLAQGRTALNPCGKIILNLAGRPGRKRLMSLFRDAGYSPYEVVSTEIRQHAKTSLASLAALEKSGHGDFEFFADSSCKEPIDAQEAEVLRVEGHEVYHRIYVIAGTLV